MPEEKSTIIIFIITTTLFILLLIAFIVFILFLYQRRQLAHKKGVEMLKADFDKTLLSSQLEMQEQTFRNISREIHDNIGLALTMAKLNLNTIDWQNNLRTQEQVEGSVHFISQAIDDLRYISKSLNTDFIQEQGLVHALEWEIQKIQKLRIFQIRLEVTGSAVYMQTQHELVIFRIMQEVFNNIIKHAQATNVHIKLHYLNDFVDIHITDNGKGFRQDGATTNGTGLINIVKRAMLINGTCQVNSQPGQGTTVIIHIPIKLAS